MSTSSRLMSPLRRLRVAMSAALPTRYSFPSLDEVREILWAGIGQHPSRGNNAPSHDPARHWYGVVRTFNSEELIGGKPEPVACAIAVISDGFYSAFQFFVRQQHDQTPKRREATLSLVGVDAFEYLYKTVEGHQRTLSVYVHQPQLRNLLLPSLNAFPQCAVDLDPVDARLAKLNAIAGTQIDLKVHRQQAELAGLPRKDTGRLVVATDASLRSRHRGAGIACVSDEGVAQSRFRAQIGRIDVAELAAIELALDTFNDGRSLHILVDSRDALSCLVATNRVVHHGIAAIVDRINMKRASRHVTFEWVRAHNGHPLNETAHRLAVAARRCYTSQVTPDTQQRIVSGILADLA
ncbi:hypothetical protein IEU95_12150 [Hoyosella rhizosphaerae]|uniref:RNase H type-1 domain-containing protein n=1 Tax=Hoyosella rhizosphaerae TaxID=1755582 RepID=A0A916U8R1_9ACTN|nr:RNase H family protein [Hoyosella rhizosphaerae]MBN4927586.1 hypothetical protein [Hoyosella rhizosphaerae]GGC63297.1 hypothetical protein GCM10011410_14670 [Hoyosella rhizosphaerae]